MEVQQEGASVHEDDEFHDIEGEDGDNEDLQTPNCQPPFGVNDLGEFEPSPVDVSVPEIELRQRRVGNVGNGDTITTDDLELRRATDKRRLIGERMAMKGEQVIFEIEVASTRPANCRHPARARGWAYPVCPGGPLGQRTISGLTPVLLSQHVCQLTNYRMILRQVPGTARDTLCLQSLACSHSPPHVALSHEVTYMNASLWMLGSKTLRASR